MTSITGNMVFTEESTLSVPELPLTLSNVPRYTTNRLTKSWEHDIRYVLGQSDYFDIVRMRKQNTFTLSYDLAETSFIQYAIAPPAGTGTIAKSRTFILPITVNGVQKYRVFDGVKTNTCNLEFRDYYSIEESLIARNISKPLTEDELKLQLGLTTTADITFPSPPSDLFWSNLEPEETTQKPLSINGTDYRTTGMTIQVERNTTPAHATANSSFWHLEAMYRGISGTLEMYYIDDTLEDLMENWTTVNIVYTLNDSPSRTCTLTGCKLHNIGTDLSAGDNRYQMQNINFSASSITINTS
ncbi:MAG: phage tail tube protein [Candidatus Nitrosocosmicus sp.]|nr:phage tail tube protein [Candidatus Nitrosocosmicus sp.]